MPDSPLAYHITFGTYGTRLHGDPRGTVDRTHNHPGDPVVGHNEAWQQMEHQRLSHKPISLTIDQRLHVEQRLPEICRRGQWIYHRCACQPDHVHVLLSTSADGRSVRRWLKRWLSESLSTSWSHTGPWWSEGGSIKWVWDDDYFERVAEYIDRQKSQQTL